MSDAKRGGWEFYKDFGFANGWHGQTPPEIQKCREMRHKTEDVDRGHPKGRGKDHVVTCDICKIKYHYDSSD